MANSTTEVHLFADPVYEFPTQIKFEEVFTIYEQLPIIASNINDGLGCAISFSSSTKENIIYARDSKGVVYVKGGQALHSLINNHAQNITYCLLFANEGNKWSDDNKNYFETLAQRTGQCIFVDLEHPKSSLGVDVQKTRIEKYNKGMLIVSDYLQDERRKKSICLVKATSIEITVKKPKTTAFLEIPCPNSLNSGTCSKDDCIWACDECEQSIEICSANNFCYCKCGTFLPTNLLFRCKEPSTHGDNFISFPEHQLKQQLSQYFFGRKNILIVGETGVGKSTWINTIFNYLCHTSLADAFEDPICVIPSRFAITNKEMETQFIHAGIPDEKNESTNAGKSFCFVDTPGTGDTAGSEKDKVNLRNTIRYISELEEVQGICIVMKPNEARLSVAFQYCIGELLTHLHKDAAANIVFCFTNTSGNQYTPVFNEAARAYIDLEIKSIIAENEAGASCKIKLLKESLQKVEEEKHMLELCVAKGKPVEDTITLSDVATFLRVIGYSKNDYLKCISMDPATIKLFLVGFSIEPRLSLEQNPAFANLCILDISMGIIAPAVDGIEPTAATTPAIAESFSRAVASFQLAGKKLPPLRVSRNFLMTAESNVSPNRAVNEFKRQATIM
uniref:G domain-containing protein n=1 Tax=Ditylenchus dipsaci TaxID=166011 RepID=A0A915E5W3_9BILA